MMGESDDPTPCDEAAITREIRERVEVGDWAVLEGHFDPHRATDGFNLDDVIAVILRGRLFESRPLDDRYLFFGRLPGLKPNRAYQGDALHAVIEWQRDTGVVVITAYRPRVGQWRTMDRRNS